MMNQSIPSNSSLESLHEKLDRWFQDLKELFFQIKNGTYTKLDTRVLEKFIPPMINNEQETFLATIQLDIEYLIANKILDGTHQEKFKPCELTATMLIFQLLTNKNNKIPQLFFDKLKLLIIHLGILRNHIAILFLPDEPNPEEEYDLNNMNLELQHIQDVKSWDHSLVKTYLLSFYLNDEKNIFRREGNSFYLLQKAIEYDSILLVELFTTSAIKQQHKFLDYKIWLYSDENEITPLQLAIKLNYIHIYLMLYQLIVSEKNFLDIINEKTINKQTLLHFACELCRDLIIKNPKNEEINNIMRIIQSLIYVGANMHSTNWNHATPLYALPSTHVLKLANEAGIFVGKKIPSDVKNSLLVHEEFKNLQLLESTDRKSLPAIKYYAHLAANIKKLVDPMLNKEYAEYMRKENEYAFNHPEIKKEYLAYVRTKESLLNLTLNFINFNEDIYTVFPDKKSIYPNLPETFYGCISFLREKPETSPNPETIRYQTDLEKLSKLINNIDAFLKICKKKT